MSKSGRPKDWARVCKAFAEATLDYERARLDYTEAEAVYAGGPFLPARQLSFQRHAHAYFAAGWRRKKALAQLMARVDRVEVPE